MTRILPETEPKKETANATTEAGIFPVSFCIIATEQHFKEYHKKLLESLPLNAEICVLLNEPSKGEESLTEAKTETDTNGGRLTHRKWFYTGEFHFAKARNLAHEMATNEWCFWLDCDDRLNPIQHELLIRSVELAPDGCGVVMANCTSMTSGIKAGEQPNYSSTKQARLYRKSYGKWEGRCHEQIWNSIAANGFTAGHSAIVVTHVGYDTSPDVMKSKNLRNVNLLCHEIAERGVHDPQSKFFLEMLRRDLNNFFQLEDS